MDPKSAGITGPTKGRSGRRGPALSGADIADILRWSARGLTQTEIATRFSPPRSQATISKVLRQYGTDTTPEAKQILRAGAAQMAVNVMRRGLPRDHIQALRGVQVLDGERQQALSVTINGIVLAGMPETGTVTASALPALPASSDSSDPL